ncbi:MAG: DUF642 domain-containing protein [Streptomyces sp.]|uniref:DUF642 domain-containing protein n=1 Tax=Streptomyces sp. TaxID=1931 RepID=UPI003D6A1FA7
MISMRLTRRLAAVSCGLALTATLCAGTSTADSARSSASETVAAAAAHGRSAMAGNLIRNGTFDAPTLPNKAKSRRDGDSVQGEMKGWEGINPGGFDLLNAKLAAHPRGYQAVDLGAEYSADGGIEQDIRTEDGGSYTLSFEHSPDAWKRCKNQDTSFSVTVTDRTTGANMEQTLRAATADGSAHWKSVEMQFSAGGTDSNVAFRGNGSSSCQAAITNVRVQQTG